MKNEENDLTVEVTTLHNQIELKIGADDLDADVLINVINRSNNDLRIHGDKIQVDGNALIGQTVLKNLNIPSKVGEK